MASILDPIKKYKKLKNLLHLGPHKTTSRAACGLWVGQPWSMACESITSKNIQSEMNYIAKNTPLHLATQAVTDEQRNFVTTAIFLHTSVLWFSHIASILTDSCIMHTSCMNIVHCLHSV